MATTHPDTESVSEKLRELRTAIKSKGSIAEMARRVGMSREWLSRVVSPKTAQKLEEVEDALHEE